MGLSGVFFVFGELLILFCADGAMRDLVHGVKTIVHIC